TASPGPASSSVPSSSFVFSRPETTKATCVCWHHSVPTSGLTDWDQRHPGCSSNRPITASPTLAISILPLSNLRVSSGDLKFLRTTVLRVAVPSAMFNLLTYKTNRPRPPRYEPPCHAVNRTFDRERSW